MGARKAEEGIRRRNTPKWKLVRSLGKSSSFLISRSESRTCVEDRSCQGRPEAAREGASESVLEINSWEHCCMSYSLREGVCEVQSQVEGGAFSEGASVVTRPSRSWRSRRVLRVLT